MKVQSEAFAAGLGTLNVGSCYWSGSSEPDYGSNNHALKAYDGQVVGSWGKALSGHITACGGNALCQHYR